MTMPVKVIKFDLPLLGVPNISSGYRVTINTRDVPAEHWTRYRAILNWFCNKYQEEGVEIATSKSSHAINGSCWSVFGNQTPRESKITVVVADLLTLQKASQDFDWQYVIDSSQTVSSAIEEAVAPYLFSKVTSKLLRRIQAEIASRLTRIGVATQWFDVKVNADGTRIQVRDTCFSICCHPSH
jgi:hypothetical protein